MAKRLALNRANKLRQVDGCTVSQVKRNHGVNPVVLLTYGLGAAWLPPLTLGVEHVSALYNALRQANPVHDARAMTWAGQPC
jgi:hypothetical protein